NLPSRCVLRIVRPPSSVNRPPLRARPYPFRNDGNEPEDGQHRERRQQLRGQQQPRFERNVAVAAAGGEAGLVGRLLRGDHTVEAGAEHGKGEGRWNDADRGRRLERRQGNAEQGGREIDEPERKRHQPQKQHVAERIGAKAVGEFGRPRTGAARRVPPAAVLGDREDEGGTEGGPRHGGKPAGDGAEEKAADRGQDRAGRDRQGGYRDIEPDEGRDRRALVRGDEAIDDGAMPYQRLEGYFAMQPRAVDRGGDERDRRQRPQAADRKSVDWPAFSRGRLSVRGGHD